MSAKTISIIMWSALGLGALGAIYILTQPSTSVTAKQQRDNIIAGLALALLGIGGGISLAKKA